MAMLTHSDFKTRAERSASAATFQNFLYSSCSNYADIMRKCTSENAPSAGAERVDRVVCGNSSAKWRMRSVTVLQ